MTPAEHARRRAALAARLQREFRAAWGRVEARDIRSSWRAQIPRLLFILTSAQSLAARSADRYVSAGSSPWEIVPGAFSGVASDGRELESLLWRPAVSALTLLGGGAPLPVSLAGGRLSAELIGHSQVADAGRVADLVAGAADERVRSYTRMVVGKTCSRCLVLAGRRYSWKADFKRHPRCDCIAVPSAEVASADPSVNVKAAFAEMSRVEQDRVFTKAGAAAIREGADIAQVVNARQGMQGASIFGRQVLATTTGRGRGRRVVRLMPEQIFRDAAGNRDETIRLLSLHGYIRAKG